MVFFTFPLFGVLPGDSRRGAFSGLKCNPLTAERSLIKPSRAVGAAGDRRYSLLPRFTRIPYDPCVSLCTLLDATYQKYMQ